MSKRTLAIGDKVTWTDESLVANPSISSLFGEIVFYAESFGVPKALIQWQGIKEPQWTFVEFVELRKPEDIPFA